MIINHGENYTGDECEAAARLGKLACTSCPEIESSKQIVLEIFPSVQCYGQNPQDIDLLVFYADYRPTELLLKTKNGRRIHSFCATIEIKSNIPENVIFEGSRCSVVYRDKIHNVTSQSEGQKYSLKKFIEKQSKSNAPWIVNLIWLTNVPHSFIPKIDTNLLGMDVSWEYILDVIAMLSGVFHDGKNVETFSNRIYLNNILAIFSKRIEVSRLDRKRLETLTKSVLDKTKQQYADKLGNQLLIFRGRGGTGKTVRLLQIAYQAYEEYGMRILILTYNKALVADIRRLLTLMHVKDAIGEGSIVIRTIHSFMKKWLSVLGIIPRDDKKYLLKYEQYKELAISYLKGKAISSDDIDKAKAEASRDLLWDLILIDESQDWPVNERDLIYTLYSYKNVIIADGIDQFVRGTRRIDWREGISRAESQVISLTKSLRLKAALCQTVKHFTEQIEYGNWNLEPQIESHGGKVIVVAGQALKSVFYNRLDATAKADGNHPIDILLCVPPSWVDGSGDDKQSIVAKKFISWGWNVWDGTNTKLRDEYPTSLDQYRIVQYDSCRGLEGWVVVCFALDEFYEYKRSAAEISEQEKADLFYEEEVAITEFAKRWIMIPLTRAIDTLVIHVKDENSYIGKKLRELYKTYPNDIEWIKYD